ncbi:MAG TPA: MdtA/MuxA family multidrug efflux RND transporter periplasmic adaptor subunit [Accumulibacter sp.]|uniref:MdtA/MuxA family multidrug efflux RND transporter periplasmic adaptor subunit n=1 Tax=Accumulibacter sp. TaxID=2053492 RepID=UPI0025ED8C0A|nr:MdtA/MuxA family multidrug efflux RND transporter periplasmic adaptor subunit [Accumulibacter sp.]MCM8598824.1 MdtA/MuxA family multidrug efflux RND transporter periplasmic adaptor subunit [Accumulibacter sp.]MCM8662909.1 MdtA/MuxA family multidrug efflux RND transporter periplasmic adaptor subunit [Accumulibacter sp.]HNC52872.1 MdtA/MuxA family multidrug efflux RND transporter periplasmic adaptor subunit [Accumulibacter sp.]
MASERNSGRWIPGRRGGWIAVFLLLAAVVGGVIYFRGMTPAVDGAAGSRGRGPAGNRPQSVAVAEVRIADLPIWVPALGTAVPRNLVTVRSRVDGELIRLHFREGDVVRQGQPLAEIDPRPFRAQLAEANGQLQRDVALLKNAEIDLERYRTLWAQDSIAKQQLDTQEALVRQYRGTIEADRAQVASARLQLDFAHIVAPVAGRVGLRQVDPGNQIHANDTNGLVVVAQVQPMTVVFAVPESYLPALRQRIAAGQPVVVEGWDRDFRNRLANGRLLALDNLVDPATGTIRLKAEFANADHALFPNQFVNVRLLLGTQKNATLVPGAAIQRGAQGSYVYAVDADDVVKSVRVVPGTADGEVVAVDGPLAAGTRVVTDGVDKLRDGTRIEVITPEVRGGERGGQGKRRGDGGRPPEGSGQNAAGAADGQAERPRRSAGGQPAAAN